MPSVCELITMRFISDRLTNIWYTLHKYLCSTINPLVEHPGYPYSLIPSAPMNVTAYAK